MFAYIVPLSKTFDDVGLLYKIPDSIQQNLKLGQVVEISIKNKIDFGIVYKIVSNIPIFVGEKSKIIKDILNIKNENIFLSNYRLELLPFIAEHYFCSIHNSLSLFLPKNLKEKIKNGKLNFLKTGDYNYKFNCGFSLSLKQKDAYDKILISKNNKILLFGITGSGKTEIYIQLIKTVLDEGKQVLFLIPEIVLGNQILERIKLVFGEDVIILNSITPDAKKTKYFLDILHNKAKIILGTRSALFYPYDNLGLIIIDEEHDNSYISEQAPRYNTLEVAKKIVDINGSKTKLLFGSGTPSVNSMYKAIRGEFELVNLLEKYK